MAKNRRREKGQGSLFFDKGRKRWIFTQSIFNEETGKTTLKKKTLKANNRIEAKEESEEYLQYSNINSKEEFIEKVVEARGIDTNLTLVVDSWGLFYNSPNRRDSGEETLKNYLRYFTKFKNWCLKNNVDSIEKVTPQLICKNWKSPMFCKLRRSKERG